jgi:outer membrane biosynthesis protein TonB
MAKLPTTGKKEKEVKEEKAKKDTKQKETKKDTKKAAPKEEAAEPKKRGRKALSEEEKAAKAAEAPAENEHIDPESFIYTIRAGKTYTGFAYGEALDFLAGVLGKVEKIVISANPK